MVRYREFAPQIEVAEAVATWPIVHKAAVQTGRAADAAAPHGDLAAKERIARERMTMPAAAAQAIRQTPPPGTVPAPPATPQETPAGDQLFATFGKPVHGARAEPDAAATEPAPQLTPRDTIEPGHQAAEPIMTGFEAPRGEPYDSEHAEPARHHPARERSGLFGGEYRGIEREARPSNRVADRQDRSLDAVFSRLSGAPDRLPDPRGRARTSPGLGAVFGRLR